MNIFYILFVENFHNKTNNFSWENMLLNSSEALRDFMFFDLIFVF